MPMSSPDLPDHPEQTFVAGSAHAGSHAAADLLAPATGSTSAKADETQTLVDPSAQPSMRPMANSPDRANAAGYHMLRQIGQGGMGEVWEAEQISLGRVIAVKRLRQKAGQQEADDSFLKEAFHGESAIAASLEHPNILPVYDLGHDADGTLLLAMKRVHGHPWKEQLQAEFPDAPVESFLAHHIPILMSVTQAVAFAHSRGIIHRDLKPAQVLVGAFGEVLLTDWGLAVRFGADPKTPQPSVRSHAPTPDTATNPAGTPSMMAPEQTETHGGNLGPWTDVYLLGGTLYYLLTGHYPHAADSSEAAFAQARTGRVQTPGERVPGRMMPAELEQLCLRALEPEKDKRLPSAAAFLKGLEDYQRGTARKEKSTMLVAQVERDLAASEPDYARYTAAIASLDEARHLWPDNPAVPPLRQRTLHGNARLALNQGDLSFARLQCHAMDDNAQTATLRADIAQRQRQMARRRSMLRLATAAVFVLLVVIAGGALMFSSRMRAANQEIAQHAQETEHALRIAKTRSTGAFELINFILKDLKTAMDEELTSARGITPHVRNQIAHAIAGKVASPIMTYFDSAEPKSWPQDMQLERTRQMHEVSRYFRSMARYDESGKLVKSALALRETLPNPNGEDTGRLIEQLALLHNAEEHFEEAMPLFQRLLVMEEARSPDSPEIGDLFINLGTTYWNIGLRDRDSAQLDKAEHFARRAVALFEKHPEYKRDRLPHALAVLANVLEDNGQPDQAEELLHHALDVAERTLDPKDDTLNGVLNNLGGILAREKKYDEAEKLYRRAIAREEEAFGPNGQNVALMARNIGTLLQMQHRDKDAEPWLRRAIKIQLTIAPDSPSTALAMRKLGDLLSNTGRHTEAETLFRKSLAIYTAALGPDHRETGITEYSLGLLLKNTHRLAEAQTTLKRAIKVLQESSGDDDPNTRAAQKALREISTRPQNTGT